MAMFYVTRVDTRPNPEVFNTDVNTSVRDPRTGTHVISDVTGHVHINTACGVTSMVDALTLLWRIGAHVHVFGSNRPLIKRLLGP